MPTQPLYTLILEKYGAEPGRLERISSHISRALEGQGDHTLCADPAMDRQETALYLLIKEGSADPVALRLTTGRHSIGRGVENDIFLASPFVSRTHGFLTVHDNEEMTYEDNSRNGTYVNGSMLRNETVKISSGDLLLFGTVIFVLPLRL